MLFWGTTSALLDQSGQQADLSSSLCGQWWSFALEWGKGSFTFAIWGPRSGCGGLRLWGCGEVIDQWWGPGLFDVLGTWFYFPDWLCDLGQGRFCLEQEFLIPQGLFPQLFPPLAGPHSLSLKLCMSRFASASLSLAVWLSLGCCLSLPSL